MNGRELTVKTLEEPFLEDAQVSSKLALKANEILNLTCRVRILACL